jgi:hypothetical protein
MSEIQIIEERRYPIAVKETHNDLLPYYMMECRAILGRDGKRFMVMVNQYAQTIHIEDCTSGELFVIEDDNLFNDLLEFATEHGFTNIMPPIAKDLGRKIIF